MKRERKKKLRKKGRDDDDSFSLLYNSSFRLLKTPSHTITDKIGRKNEFNELLIRFQ